MATMRCLNDNPWSVVHAQGTPSLILQKATFNCEMVALKKFDHLLKHGSFVYSSLLLRKWTGLKLKVMYIKKLRTSDWLKTRAFSYSTSRAKFWHSCKIVTQVHTTNSARTPSKFRRSSNFIVFEKCTHTY